jgi:chorismate synthase
MNTFGKKITFTSFGESHGVAIGAILDGIPAGLKIDESFIQKRLDERKPGQNAYSTPRKESDKCSILSGVFEGISTGTPISLVIYNENTRSKDYNSIKDIFRPSHGDFTYFHKYGFRDYRGGGRASARETATRVGVGAICELLLKQFGIEIFSGLYSVGNKNDNTTKDICDYSKLDYEYAKTSEIFALDKTKEDSFKAKIKQAKKQKDSIGGIIALKTSKLPIGLGEPLYHKLDATLASAMLSINASKAFEIGLGVSSSASMGSINNDEINKNGFKTNNSGGVLAGISNGDELHLRVYFKPTPSIFKPQKTINTQNEELTMELKGRHDPCVAVRAVPIVRAMCALVLADMLVLNASSNISNLEKIYNS